MNGLGMLGGGGGGKGMVWETEFKDLRYVYILIFTQKYGDKPALSLFFFSSKDFSDFRGDERRPATKAPNYWI